jgi:uncharacterized membrane protein
MKRNFLTGLVIVLPIALTFIILMLFIDILTQPFLALTEKFLQHVPIFKSSNPMLSSGHALKIWSQGFILLALFAVIILLGLFARLFLFKIFIRLGDKLIHRIPIINKLYKTFKEVIEVIFATKDRAFKQVVMVHFPNPYTRCIGFLSKESPEVFNNPTKQDLISVFLPTTPNPTTGYLLQFPQSEVTHIDMTIEDALKFIVSCGIISDNNEKTDSRGHKKEDI